MDENVGRTRESDENFDGIRDLGKNGQLLFIFAQIPIHVDIGRLQEKYCLSEIFLPPMGGPERTEDLIEKAGENWRFDRESGRLDSIAGDSNLNLECMLE